MGCGRGSAGTHWQRRGNSLRDDAGRDAAVAVLVLTGSVAGTHLEMTQVGTRPWQCWYWQRRGDSLRDDAGRDAAVAVLVLPPVDGDEQPEQAGWSGGDTLSLRPAGELEEAHGAGGGDAASHRAGSSPPLQRHQRLPHTQRSLHTQAGRAGRAGRAGQAGRARHNFQSKDDKLWKATVYICIVNTVMRMQTKFN